MANTSMKDQILNAERRKILSELSLDRIEDKQVDAIYQQVTDLASKIIGAPIAVMSMVMSDRQVFKGRVGVELEGTPLSHSFCKHVVGSQQPLVVSDAREVDFLADNLAIRDLDVIGYLGMPISVNSGGGRLTLGSFCVIDHQPREWTESEFMIVRELSQIVTAEIDLRAKVRTGYAQQSSLDAMYQRIEQFVADVNLHPSQNEILQQIQHLREYHAV